MRRLSFFFFLLPFLAFSQEKDFQLWSKLELRYKINKKLGVDFSEGFRLRENARLPLKSFSEIGISYRKNKMIRSKFAYRFIQNFDKAQNLLLRHRFYADLSLRKKLKRWQLSHRARVHHQWGSNKLEQYYRSKIQGAYNIRKTPLEPSFSAELFFDLNRLIVDKNRFTLALSYPIAKKIEGNLFYRVQQETNVNEPTIQYVLGVRLSHNL